MIKSTDKLKARFEKYDKLSKVISFIFIAINVWLIFQLNDCIFIGSIIPIILFFIIMKIKVNNNNVYSIDDIDSFYNKSYDQLKKYTYYSFLLASFILLLFNCLLHFYGFVDLVCNNNNIPLGGKLFILIYAEALFLVLFLKVATKLFKIVSLYDFRSSSIFNSKNKYLIRVWNFLYYRRKVYDCADGEKSYFEIWRENKNVIVADKISVLKNEIQSLNDDFLKKMYLYHLYPYDFGGISKMQMGDLFEKILIVGAFLLPFIVGYLFNNFQNLQDIISLIQNSTIVLGVWFAFEYFWNWITRKSLLDQLKVILPFLINEELENRKLMHEGLENRKLIHEELENLKSKRKYKRPHKYK